MRRVHPFSTPFPALALLAMAACSPEAGTPPSPVASSPSPEVAVMPPVSHVCESGESTTVAYPDATTAMLTYKGQTYVLRAVQSASGARYVGSGLEWWSAARDGTESATLSRSGPSEEIGATVLERCSRALPGPAAPEPAPVLQPAPGGDPAVTPPCRGPQLKLSLEGGDSRAGNRVALLGVQNLGTQACSLTGYPSLVLRDPLGRDLTDIQSEQAPGRPDSREELSTPVELPARAKAFFDVGWNTVPRGNQGETSCPSVARLRMTAPGDTSPVPLVLALTPCGGRITVSPFRPVAESAPEPAPVATTTRRGVQTRPETA